MKFGPVRVGDAEGAILAHSLDLPSGKLRKGRELGADEVALLRDAGVEEVVAARLEPGDVHEDAAATRLAEALVPDPEAAGLSLAAAHTGRVNIYATRRGILELDAARIAALNLVDPMITLATVPQFAPIRRDDGRHMVATAKIISYAVPGAALEDACKAGAAAMRVRPVQVASARLLITHLGDDRRDDAKPVTDRLAAFGIPCAVAHVAHEANALAAAIAAAEEELILILTASATSDPQDTAPEAVRIAGGSVSRFGLPVDPGNLLFLGEQRSRQVIGLPGCARSPALNGADWVLERVICGLPPSGADMAAMGVGGLLKEIRERGRLREN